MLEEFGEKEGTKFLYEWGKKSSAEINKRIKNMGPDFLMEKLSTVTRFLFSGGWSKGEFKDKVPLKLVMKDYPFKKEDKYSSFTRGIAAGVVSKILEKDLEGIKDMEGSNSNKKVFIFIKAPQNHKESSEQLWWLLEE